MLHGAKFCRLMIVQRAEQIFEIFVEKTIPNRRFEPVAIGGADIGRAFRRLRARVTDEFEQAPSLGRVQIVLVFRGTVTRMAETSFGVGLRGSACAHANGSTAHMTATASKLRALPLSSPRLFENFPPNQHAPDFARTGADFVKLGIAE